MDIKESTVAWIVLGLILIRIIMVLGLVGGYPWTPYHQGWYLHHGGDQVEYFSIAGRLIETGAIESFRPPGYPLALTPFILWYDAHDWKTILLPAVFFNAFYLFPLSVILLAMTALACFKNKLAAVLSAFFWVFLPYLIWLAAEWALKMRHPGRLGSPGPEIWMIHQMWVNMLSDPLSTFLCILIFYLFIRDARREGGIGLPMALGLLTAFAMSVRYANILLCPAGLLVYLAAARFRKMFWYGLALTALFLPLLFYQLAHGWNPLRLINYQGVTSYTFGALNWIYLPLSVRHLFRILPFPVLLAFFILALAVLWGIYRIFKHSRLAGTAILLWTALFSGFYLSYDGVFRDFFRFLMPVFPPLIICFSVALTDLGERVIGGFKKMKKSPASDG
jgi:hypothetical protein